MSLSFTESLKGTGGTTTDQGFLTCCSLLQPWRQRPVSSGASHTEAQAGLNQTKQNPGFGLQNPMKAIRASIILHNRETE